MPKGKKLKNSVKQKIIKASIEGKKDKEILQLVPNYSQSTVSKVKKENMNLIQEQKEKYIKLINKTIGGDKTQAEVLRDSLKAETEVYNFKGEIVGTRPDHKIRLETVKYLDKLKGRDNTQKLTQNNILISSNLDRYM